MLAFGVSLDDFALAVALSLLIPSPTRKKRVMNASKMALAFSVSTILLLLLGWFVGLAIFDLVVSFSSWVVLLVFCGVGCWIVMEAFKNESRKWVGENVSAFWVLLTMGTLGSFDEAAIAIGYPFLDIPIMWILVAVVLANTALIYLAMFLSNWKENLDKKVPQILSGIMLVALGIVTFLELAFGI